MKFGPEELFPRDFGDDYELQQVLGAGGMGKVYLAVHKKLNRKSAIKIIRSEVLESADEERSKEIIDRFETEIKTTAMLSHNSIVSVYDAGVDSGRLFYSMEYIPGDSLDELLANGPISGKRAAKIVMQVAKGVNHAHQQGIIHRDIKPSNIMVDSENDAYIMDFGVAKRLDRTTKTHSSELFGTVAFMSPEQARNSSDLDERSDVYSLGAVLYFALSGKPPIVASSDLQTLAFISDFEPVEIQKINRSVPKDLNSICMKCLEKDPCSRYSTAMEFSDDLESFLNAEPVRARPTSLFRKVNRFVRQRKLQLAIGLSILLVTVSVFLLGQRYSQVAMVDSLVESLQNSEPNKVRSIVDKLRKYRSVSHSVLQVAYRKSTDERIRFRLSLPFDSDRYRVFNMVYSQRFDELFDDFDRVCLDLPEISRPEIDRMWEIAFNEKEQSLIRIRACVLLSRIDSGNKTNWTKISNRLVNDILGLDTIAASKVLIQLKRILPKLSTEFQAAFNENKSVLSGENAALALSMIYEMDPEHLCDLLVHSGPHQFGYFLPLVSKIRKKTVPILKKFAKQEVPDYPRFESGRMVEILNDDWPFYDKSELFLSDFPEDKQRAEKAIATIALLKMNEIRWEDCFKNFSDPVVKSKIVHDGVRYHCSVEALIQSIQGRKFQKNPDSDLLILTLGCCLKEIGDSNLKKRIVQRMKEIFDNDPRAGVHSAAEWVLRMESKIDVNSSPTNSLEDLKSGKSDWYVTRSGMTMAAIRKNYHVKTPVTWIRFGIDSDWPGFSKPEDFQPFAFKPYAIATKEVTRKQFDKFREIYSGDTWLKKHDYNMGRYANGPVNSLSSQGAMEYCNWLSIQNGYGPKELCYMNVDGKLVLVKDYENRKGFRLPTIWEWDNASNVEYKLLLSNLCYMHHAWVVENSKWNSQPVGTLKPNRSGLFDMYGNINEVCTHNNIGINCCFVFKGDSAAARISRLRNFYKLITFGRIVSFGGGLRVVQSIDFE